jgi:hypothetical protein
MPSTTDHIRQLIEAHLAGAAKQIQNDPVRRHGV